MPRGPIERTLNFVDNPTFGGVAKFADGTAAAPSITFASDPDTGWYRAGGNVLGLAIGGSAAGQFISTGLDLLSNSAALRMGALQDVILTRDAANTLALRNGANAQTFRVYNTYTDGSNYERARLNWASNEFVIATEAAGTGAARALVMASGSTIVFAKTGVGNRWQIDTNGHFLASTDNTYDIGGVSNAVRNLHVKSNIYLQATATTGTRLLGNAADGVLALMNFAGTDFARLTFGGTTSAFPAIKRSGADLRLRLADDTADANLIARDITSTNTITTAGQILSSAGADIALNPNTGVVSVAGQLMATGRIVSTGATNGVGYSTGAGGAVTQLTSKATGVTLNTVTGNITMEAGSLAANTAVSFTLTDSAIAATDLVVVTHHSGGTAGAYTVVGQAAAGSAVITLRNVTAGALAEAVVLKFAVIKGAVS